jgi:RND family efflux transporter MFP subunit
MNRMQLSALISVMGLSLLSVGCSGQAPDSRVDSKEIVRLAKIVDVVSAGMNAVRIYPGTLEASEKAELAFRVEGQLVELPAQPGVLVKKGELLARLDDAVYRSTFEERQARFELARIQYDQAGKLLKQKLSSQLQYDQAKAELKSAKASLDQAADNLAYTRLLAPFDGVVARVDVENHQAVQTKVAIIQLQDDRSLDIHFSVPETLIARLKMIEDPAVIQGYCGAVRFSSRPDRRYRACHKEHESVPDPLTRNYRAVFTLDQVTDFAALPGMTASIELDFSPFMPESQAKGLLVPLEAVFEKDGSKWVWQVDESGRARITQVQTGRFEGEMIEVTEGLSSGERVIAAGVSFVREEMQVKPLVKERGL